MSLRLPRQIRKAPLALESLFVVFFFVSFISLYALIFVFHRQSFRAIVGPVEEHCIQAPFKYLILRSRSAAPRDAIQYLFRAVPKSLSTFVISNGQKTTQDISLILRTTFTENTSASISPANLQRMD